jgi:hypothetical protein
VADRSRSQINSAFNKRAWRGGHLRRLGASLTNGLQPSRSNPVSGIQLGYNKSKGGGSTSGIVSVSCTGEAPASGTTTPAELLGCTVPDPPAGDTSVTTQAGYTWVSGALGSRPALWMA